MVDSKSNIALETRSGLPPSLRVLIDEFPADTWHRHENFDGLVKFWLERHVMFRKLIAMMMADVDLVSDNKLDPVQYRQRLARLGNMFVGELHTHHSIEDYQYFPRLKLLDSRLERGFEILDSDHHALDEHLQTFTGAANKILQLEEPEMIDQFGSFHDVLEAMQRFLERHLTDEEELIVPVILKYAFRG